MTIFFIQHKLTSFLYIECLQFSKDVLDNDKSHPCHPKRLEAVYYSGAPILTDAPIIGILTQPYGYGANDNETVNYVSEDLGDSFITTAHVSFLENAGARVVPVNYRLSYYKLMDLLKQINGIYIPGDSDLILSNVKYMSTLNTIYQWAQDQNVQSTNHFPVMAVSWGYIAMITPYLYEPDKYVENMTASYIEASVSVNLRINPQDSYLYDEFTLSEADTMLDYITFYNELDIGIRLGNFLNK